MSTRMPVLQVSTSLGNRLGRGHPWVYRDQIEIEPDLPTGTWVRLRCGGFSAYGLWDDASPIAVRLFSRQAVPNAAWVADRVGEAWAARACVRTSATNAYRWLYGESDGLPGIVVDLYGEYAVIQTFAACVEGLVSWVAEALHAYAPLQGILWRRREERPQPIWGRLPPKDLVVEENGILFQADLMVGQKTGLYFDHRHNRQALALWCQGRTVLDCFCYTGAFSIYALRGGAAHITACDIAAEAIDATKRNLHLNDFDPDRHSFLVGDCFDELERMATAGQRFDLVILDPPSLARSRSSRHAAVRAYVRLNQLAVRCVNTGGLLASASCTSQVSPSVFRDALAEAARKAQRRLLLLHEAGQGPDHPVPAHFPEARYLKFVVGQVLAQL